MLCFLLQLNQDTDPGLWRHIKDLYDKQPYTIWSAVGVLVLGTLAMWIAKKILTHHFDKFAAKTHNIWDDVAAEIFRKTNFISLAALSLLIAAAILSLPTETMDIICGAVLVVILIQAGIWGNRIITFFLTRYAKKREKLETGAGMPVSVFKFIAKLLLWTVLLLLILDNIGVDVTTLVAGLGVGGIAVALAVQNILGDLFSSLSILLDKPFTPGDFIVVDDLMGTVEHIGLKTTRICSIHGEQIIFSNSDLLQSRIRNYRKMRERRVLFSVGVTYQTPQDKLVAIPGIIEETIKACENVRFERSHFKNFGDYALNFESVYHVSSRDYMAYMNIQQQINYALFKRFQAEGIEFAYPTQTLFCEKDN